MFNPDLETLPRDRLRALQNERLRNLVRYVYERVPFYKTRLDAADLQPGDIENVADLPRLPFTTKQDLRDTYPFGLFAVPQRDLARIHASSGTSGKPTLVGYTKRDLATFAEVNARCLAAAGARPGMLFHNAYGYGLFTGGLGLHYGAEALGLTVVPVSGGMTERQIMLIQDLQPEVIACTPSYAQTLAGEFRARGISPDDISLKYGVLGAEPWTESIRADVESGLGIKATNIYGLSEIIGPGVSNEAVEEQAGAYIWEDHFYPEIVNPETGEALPDGEEGVLVITTLTKEALPLLRYWTGDITSLTHEPSATGRSHARMSMIRGRSDDMLVIRGVNVYPTQIEAALTGIADLALHYQLVVTRRGTLDELELKIELSEAAHAQAGAANPESEGFDSLRDRVRHRVKDTVGVTLTPTLLAPGSVPRSAGGKLRRTVDERQL
ncbi:phenylacetate--CoA ligase [soil metagenome]